MTTRTCAVRLEDALAELAAAPHGVVTRRQLIAAGFTGNAIDWRLRRKRLRPLYIGVFQVGAISGPRARELAAVFACGAGTVSHWSAAAMQLLQAARCASAPVDITVAPQRRVCRPGVRVHRSILPRSEVVALDGVPVTTVPRTLLDLGAVATSRELEQALATAERADPKLRSHLIRMLELYPRRRGSSKLRRLIAAGTPSLTRSEAEKQLLVLIRSGGLPDPLTNVTLHGHEVDCYWPGAQLVVEVDGYSWHGSHRSFLRDRERDAALTAAGIRVLRLSFSTGHPVPRPHTGPACPGDWAQQLSDTEPTPPTLLRTASGVRWTSRARVRTPAKARRRRNGSVFSRGEPRRAQVPPRTYAVAILRQRSFRAAAITRSLFESASGPCSAANPPLRRSPTSDWRIRRT